MKLSSRVMLSEWCLVGGVSVVLKNVGQGQVVAGRGCRSSRSVDSAKLRRNVFGTTVTSVRRRLGVCVKPPNAP